MDLAEVQGALVSLGGGTLSDFDDLCYDVDDGVFEIGIGGRTLSAHIHFDSGKGRYAIKSAALDQLVGVAPSGGPRPAETLTSYLNREQAFRVVTGDHRTIYAHSRFYSPRIPLGGSKAGRLDLLRVFHPIEELAGMVSEKGSHGLPDDAGWPADSVFGLVDRLGADTALKSHMEDAAVLVCDDMGAEVGDFFLGIESDPRVALIHAKAGTGQRRSATVFQELTAQALKNLEYLSPYLDRTPPNYSLWGNPWRAHGFRVRKRVRRGGNKRQAWKRLSALIRDPAATREVWLVLGAGFSVGEFRPRVQLKKQPPEDVQILYLLSALWSGVSAIGAKLRIFCSP